jgi:hypothetical protein
VAPKKQSEEKTEENSKDKPVEVKPISKSTEAKPSPKPAEKPAQKPVVIKTTIKLVGAKPISSPVEAKPAEAKPVTKPAEPKPAAKPIVKPVTKPAEKAPTTQARPPPIAGSQLKIVKWLPEAFGSVDIFGKKLASDTLKGDEDASLFSLALVEAFKTSQAVSNKEKYGYAQHIAADLEQYTNVAFFIEIRGWKEKYVISFSSGSQKVGTWAGKFDVPPTDLGGGQINNCIFLEMTPPLMLQAMKGNLNLDTQYFSEDMTASGSVKLTRMFGAWVQEFCKYVGQVTAKEA